MAKKGSSPSWWLDHLLRLDQYSGRVSRIYQKYVDEFTQLAAAIEVDPARPFSFDDYPTTKAAVTKAMNKIVNEVSIEIDRGTRQEWLESAYKNDKLVDQILLTSGLSRDQIDNFYNHNLEALSSFQRRKDGSGLDLSDRIWRNTEQYKQEIELGIDAALGEGKSAAKLSQDVRGYLKEPDKLFRRIRDKRGNLQLSKNAKAYHPGRGVYRSSYRNAMRLAVSETNMAYKVSDQTRWEQLPIVVGYEIKLSNNHPERDICDELKGTYPKTFQFKGWHPFCRCYVVSILISDDERDRLQQMILNGEDLSGFSSSLDVSDVPDNFKKWCVNNADRVKNWSSTPYWIRDNFKNGDLSKGLNLKIPTKKPTPPVEKPTPAPNPKTKPVADPPRKTYLEPSKTLEEAERRFRERCPGITIDYSGFKKMDSPIIDEIRKSADYHLNTFPELDQKIRYFGSVSNKYKRLQDVYRDEYLKMNYGGWISDQAQREKYISDSVKKIPGVKSRSPRSTANTYAYSDPWDKGGLNGICWNDKYGMKNVNALLENDVRNRFHPVGCNTPKSIIDHELGHKIDELLDFRKDPDFLKVYQAEISKGRQYIADNLSRYAWEGQNPTAEFIAEAWSEFLNNPDPRPIAKTIGNMILTKYKQKYPRSAR